MSFDMNTLHVIEPLGLIEGDKYNEPVNEYAQILIIENTNNITWCKEDYINSTVNGELIWRSVNSYGMDLENAMT
jgi:hypothetical protein